MCNELGVLHHLAELGILSSLTHVAKTFMNINPGYVAHIKT